MICYPGLDIVLVMSGRNGQSGTNVMPAVAVEMQYALGCVTKKSHVTEDLIRQEQTYTDKTIQGISEPIVTRRKHMTLKMLHIRNVQMYQM